MARLSAFLKVRTPYGIEAETIHADQASVLDAWSCALAEESRNSGVVDVSFARRMSPDAWRFVPGRLLTLPGATLALPRIASHSTAARFDGTAKEISIVASGFPDLDNPFDVASIASPAFLAVPLHQLTLTRRAKNVFLNSQLETVADVLALGFDGLMDLRQFGVGSVRDLAHAFMSFLDSGDWIAEATTSGLSSETEVSACASGSSESKSPALVEDEKEEVTFEARFFDAFIDALRQLSPRDAVVLAGRLGHGGPPQTLEELGVSLGVSRERARQLEKRAIETVAAQTWVVALVHRLTELLDGRDEPLYLDLIAAEDTRFDGFQENLELLGRIIAMFATQPTYAWVLNGRLIASRLAEDELTGLRQRILAHLESQLSTKLSAAETRLIIESICAGSGARELRAAVYESIEPYLHYSGGPNTAGHLVAIGRGLRHALVSIFYETDRPLHFREVRERLAARGYEAPNESSLRTAIRSSGALLFGRSTYGTIRHVGLDAHEIRDIRDELVEIINAEPDHQWHGAELIEELQRRGVGSADEMDRYTVGALLDGSPEVEFLGRLVWTARRRSRLTPRDRREVADLIEAVLVEAGRPLTKAELRQAIERARGLNSNFLPQPTERVVRLRAGTWGLADRDCRVPADVCESAFRMLESILFRRGRALHVSELSGVLAERGIDVPEDNVPELFGRAQVDPRFRVARGNFVALPGWDSLGRATMAEAQEQVLGQLHTPMTLDQIHAELQAITERAINRSHVASWLNRSGVGFDPQSGTWAISDDPQDQEEDSST